MTGKRYPCSKYSIENFRNRNFSSSQVELWLNCLHKKYRQLKACSLTLALGRAGRCYQHKLPGL